MLKPISSRPCADAESAMRFMLLELLKPLVDHPEHCSVDVVRLDDTVTFVVGVAACDMEKFIGSNLRTSKSLRVIVSAVGAKSQRRFSLMFRDDLGVGEHTADLLPTVIKDII